MIDALLYAVRDYIRAAGIGYGAAECEIMDDGRPPPRAGNWFVAVHSGKASNSSSRNLDERYGFSLTLTARVVSTPLDRVGDQLIARNLPLKDINSVPLAQRQGFNARIEQLRALVGGSGWAYTVLVGQKPPSANDNIVAWATGTVYGFVEPAIYRGADVPTLVGGDWFASEPDAEDVGIKAEMRFDGARRMQPQTAVVGPYV